MTGAGTNGLLDGIVVLDLTRVLAGPVCGRALADLGARVVKVEPPAGDLTRFSVPRHGPTSAYFAQQNVGKENVSIDLDQPDGRRLLFELACRADVVLENFRPGVCARLGVGYDAVSAANPRVVYGSVSGYGQHSPWASRRAYAVVSHAASGFTNVQLQHLSAASGAQVAANEYLSHGDLYSGLLTVSGVLAALFARERTGTGQHVDVAMVDAMAFVNEHATLELSGEVDLDDLRILSSRWSPVLTAANGDRVTAASDPAAHGWSFFRAALGHPPDPDDSPLQTWEGRAERAFELRAAAHDWAATIPDGDTLVRLLEEAGIAADHVRTTRDLAASEHARARGTFAEVDDRVGGSFAVPQTPWRFSDAASGVAGPPAWRGEHNRTALADLLGLDDAALDALERDRVLVARPPRSKA